jgi:hypothetical protein
MYARTFFFLSHLPLIFSLTYRSEKS